MKISKYFSLTFLIIIFSFSIGIYFNIIFVYINKKPNNTNHFDEAKKCSNYVDWKKEYPIDKINEFKPNNEKKIKESDHYKIHLVYKKITKTISNIDTCSKAYFPCKMQFIEFGHFINKLIGGNIFLNLDGLIRFDNGYFGFIVSDKDSFEEDGKRTVDFAKYLEKQKIKFGYILCPSKFSKFKKELPQGMVDYSNENADSFLKVLYDNNINVLDLREDLNKEFPDHFGAFFKTDHHWKPETGFWASQKIIKFLNQQLGQNLDENIIKKENFNFKTYPKLFLGSQGKKVTLSFAEPEDFTVITPKFNTDFKLEVYCRDIIKEGNFEKSLLSPDFLLKNYYEINNLSTYLGYITPLARIQNNLTTNNNKIMFIKDSFICVVAPFISCATKELLLVERRVSQWHFDGSIKKLIEKEKPNTVLILYHCGLLSSSSKDRQYLHSFK